MGSDRIAKKKKKKGETCRFNGSQGNSFNSFIIQVKLKRFAKILARSCIIATSPVYLNTIKHENIGNDLKTVPVI